MAAYDQYGFNKNLTKYDLTAINSYIDSQITGAISQLLDKSWPVGSIMWLADAQTPASKGFPGTWQKLPDDYYVVTASSPKITATGGSNSVSINAENLPAHSHLIVYTSDISSARTPFRRVRLHETGNGSYPSQTVPRRLWMKFTSRRGTGDGTVNMDNSAEDSVTTVKKDTSYSAYSKVFDVVDSTPSVNNGRPDSFTLDFTAKAKIDGSTSDGIYTEAAYNAGQALTKKNLSIKPQYIGLAAYKRVK